MRACPFSWCVLFAILALGFVQPNNGYSQDQDALRPLQEWSEAWARSLARQWAAVLRKACPQGKELPSQDRSLGPSLPQELSQHLRDFQKEWEHALRDTEEIWQEHARQMGQELRGLEQSLRRYWENIWNSLAPSYRETI